MQALPARFVRGVASLGALPKAQIPEVATSGRSNVGKSSLLNVIFRQKKLAKVSQTPGKTQELNFFSIEDRFHLVDLPGYGYARAPKAVQQKWSRLVEAYLESREQLCGVVQLLDIRHGPTRADQDMLRWLTESDQNVLLVATKADKLKASQRAAARKWLSDFERRGFRVVEFSAETREGRKLVLDWIDEVITDWRPSRKPEGRI